MIAPPSCHACGRTCQFAIAVVVADGLIRLADWKCECGETTFVASPGRETYSAPVAPSVAPRGSSLDCGRASRLGRLFGSLFWRLCALPTKARAATPSLTHVLSSVSVSMPKMSTERVVNGRHHVEEFRHHVEEIR